MSKVAIAPLAAASALLIIAGQARAHPGHHDAYSVVEALQHFSSLWHVLPVLAGAASAVAIVVILQRRRLAKASRLHARRNAR